MFQGKRGVERGGERMKEQLIIYIGVASVFVYPVVAYFLLKSMDENIWKE